VPVPHETGLGARPGELGTLEPQPDVISDETPPTSRPLPQGLCLARSGERVGIDDYSSNPDSGNGDSPSRILRRASSLMNRAPFLNRSNRVGPFGLAAGR
jgi:hypothetical protein